jgi:hypothetical protein
MNRVSRDHRRLSYSHSGHIGDGIGGSGRERSRSNAERPGAGARGRGRGRGRRILSAPTERQEQGQQDQLKAGLHQSGGGVLRRPSAISSRSMNSPCAELIFSRASPGVNQAHRSTSGKVSHRPDPRGHSVFIVLLVIPAGSASPSQPQAWTTLPAFWRMAPSEMKGPSGSIPVSSSNSRRAAASSSSPGSASPFGMVQAPASRAFQNGPPGWARNSSRPPGPLRKRSSPALRDPVFRDELSRHRNNRQDPAGRVPCLVHAGRSIPAPPSTSPRTPRVPLP